MASTLPVGPYRFLPTPDGGRFPYYVMPYDKDGVCEGPQSQAHLLANLAGVTDLFIFSHGWNNDWTAATTRYESFITGFQRLRTTHSLVLPDHYNPLLVGVFWPSQAMTWFESETGPEFAATGAAQEDAATSELHAALREIAAQLPPDKRQRFHALAQSRRLEKGQDQELADLLAGMLQGTQDTEAGTDSAPAAADLLAAAASFETPEPDLDEIGVATTDDAGEPAAAGFAGKVLSVLDPRNLVKPFTVWQMKDRAGTVGAKGVAPLLAQLLTKSDSARIHLIGHSFGCKVVMTAVSVMPESDRKVESALLLQGAVSQYAFSADVPERNKPGGFANTLTRIRRPIIATFSQRDAALRKGFPLSVRRHDDVGELQFAGKPSKYGALGGEGPQATVATMVKIKDPYDPYDLAHSERILGVDGTRTISGHGDISIPSTWWAAYCLLTAHLAGA